MALPSIIFDNYDSYDLWGLFVVTKTVKPPKPKIYKVDIPGGNGSIDITESILGSVAFEDREVYVKLRGIGIAQSQWPTLYSEIQDKIQGRKMKIVLSDDPGYYYKGRPEVTSFHYDKDVGELEITCDCEPFKYQINAYGFDWLWDPFDFLYGVIYDDTKTITGTTAVELETLKMPVTPTFRANTAMTVTYQGVTYVIPANRDITFYELVLTEGTHTLTFKCSGTGTVKIMFTNGIL